MHGNARYLAERLRQIGIRVDTEAAIIPLKIPSGIDIRDMGRRFQDAGLFMNAIEYPAVSLNAQQFRINVVKTLGAVFLRFGRGIVRNAVVINFGVMHVGPFGFLHGQRAGTQIGASGFIVPPQTTTEFGTRRVCEVVIFKLPPGKNIVYNG